MQASDTKKIEEAKRIFETKQGLDKIIKEKIFPCVVSTLNNRGVIGSGFFYHSKWLVSNAHVIPCYEVIEDTTIIGYQLAPTSIHVEEAYYRPHQEEKSPDVIVINVKNRNGGEECLSSITQFNHEKVHDNTIVFYVYFNHDTQNFEIKYLTPHKTEGFPLFYNCEDNTDPQPGCSGAPVIGAYVSTNKRELEWHFYMIGALYARCPSEQIDSKLACVIPITHEFEQILKDIIYPMQLAERCELMGQASTYIRGGESKANKYYTDEQEYKEKVERGLQLFEAGKTVLDIDLPDGLEKLIGKSIIRLQGSMLLSNFQQQYSNYQFEYTIYTTAQLTEECQKFINWIQGQELLKLNIGNRTVTSKFFRVDITGGKKDEWKLDLQDNVGQFKLRLTRPHRNMLYQDYNPKPSNNPEPASSVFAIVKIPKEMDSIQGAILFQLFNKSLTEVRTVHYNEMEQEKHLTTHYRDRKRERSEQYRKQCEMEEDAYANQEVDIEVDMLSHTETDRGFVSSVRFSPKRRSPSPSSP